MHLLPAGQHRRMVWKNGGGETIEVAVHPPRSSLEDFDWRVSMARVAVDGPFSTFPGVDRTLALLEGRGLDLKIGDAPPRRLEREGPPFAFPGDVATSASLVDGPVRDLNVMSRRSRFCHRVELSRRAARLALPHQASTVLLLAISDVATVHFGDEETMLARDDALLLDAGDRTASSDVLETRGDLYLIAFAPVGA